MAASLFSDMSDRLRLHLQVDADKFDEIPACLRSASRDLSNARLMTNASAVGKAGYVFRITNAPTDQPPDLAKFLFDALRQVAEAPTVEKAQLIARCALALSK